MDPHGAWWYKELAMAGMFDQTTVFQVQQANDIVDVISEHVSLKNKGREMVGLCPFHDDHRPSMNVSIAKQIFKCFACGAGGDVFKFVQMRENLTFPQAIERLAERAGIKLKTTKAKRPQVDRQPEDIDPNQLAKINAWAAEYFQINLNDSQKGKQIRDYIAQRKITPESIKKWRLGLAVSSQDDLIQAAKVKKVPMGLLEKAGLVTGQNQDKFINRLMFTITDVTGRVIGFGGRTLSEAGAKYINSPSTVLFDKSNSLYGLEQARHEMVTSGTAVVVEGYTDCIMAHQFGCTNVVASLGTSFTPGHGRILRRYAKKVVLVFDNDVAGVEAANRALEICLSQRIDIKLAAVPEGKDPCDFLLAAGKEQFERLVDEAVDVFQYKWDRIKQRFGADETLTGKKAAAEEFLQAIAIGLSAHSLPLLEHGLIVNKLSRMIGLDNKQINRELTQRINRLERTASYNVENQRAQSEELALGLFAAAQQEVLEVLLNEPRLYRTVREQITAEVFDEPVLSQIAEILFETLSCDIDTSLAEILARTESVELGRYITKFAQAGELKGNFQPRLTGALRAIERHLAEKETNEIRAIGDQKQFLRSIYKNTVKENPHNVGMV